MDWIWVYGLVFVGWYISLTSQLVAAALLVWLSGAKMPVKVNNALERSLSCESPCVGLERFRITAIKR